MGTHIWKFFIKRSEGFTLAEMLIVVSIITVLVTISLNSFNNQGRRARDDRRMADLEQIRSALEMFRLASPTRVYPATLAPLVTAGFLTVLPQDPFTNGNFQYYYRAGAGNAIYSLCARTEVATGGPDCTAAGEDCGTQAGPQATCTYQVTNP